MNSQNKIIELIEGDHEMAARGANAEGRVMHEYPQLERGSEEFYKKVLELMQS